MFLAIFSCTSSNSSNAVSYTHLTPQQDALQLGTHLFDKERVVCAVGRLVLSGQDKLAAKETVRMVIQRGQRTVAEAEEPGVNIPLVALDTLAPVSYTHLDVYKRQGCKSLFNQFSCHFMGKQSHIFAGSAVGNIVIKAVPATQIAQAGDVYKRQ